MTKKITRLIALLLSILMSLSLIPAGILAAENNETIAADSTSNTTTIENSSEQLDQSNEVLDVQTETSTTSTPASRAPQNTEIQYPVGTVFNIVTYLTLRDKPLTDGSNEIDRLKNGDLVKITDYLDGFFKVISSKGEGFVTAQYVKLKYPLARVVDVSSYLALRSKPLKTGANELKRIPNGALIQLTGKTDGDYSEAIYDGETGWVTTQYTQEITLESGPSPGGANSGTDSGSGPSQTEIQYPVGTVFNIVTYLTLRDKPLSNSSNEIDRLKNGDLVKITDYLDDFFKVISSKGEGFVTAQYVKLKYPLARVVDVSSYLALRSKPLKTGVDELKRIPNGALIQLTGKTDGDYSEAIYDGEIGWVTTQYTQKISLTGSNSGSSSKPLYSSGTGSGTGADYGPLTGKTTAGMAKYGIVRVNYTLNVRSGPSINDPIIGSLKANDIVTIMSDDNGWMTISWPWSGGDVAYCSSEYVKYGEWVYLSYAQTDSRLTANWKSIHNMQLAASNLHYHIVKPGELFSWKETIGAATYDKGYIDAGIIINNAFSEGPGGGVCQVSTTINWAAMIAGFKTDRVAHAFPRSYVPDVKYEATVAIPYGVNFSFTNTKSAPIRFVFDTDGSSCLCELQIFYYTP